MFFKEDFIRFGRFAKTHGNSGDITIKADSKYIDSIENVKYVFANIENGLVPFEIVRFSIRNSDTLQLTLVELNSLIEAEKLIGLEVFIQVDIKNEVEENNPSSFIINQYMIKDKKEGDIGLVMDILEINNNPLFKIIIGKKEILIPYNEAFIEKIDHDKRIIFMDLPEGLLIIND